MFFTKISRSGLISILVSSFFDVAALLPVVDEDNFRAFVGLTEEVSDVAAVLPVIDEDNFSAFVGLMEEISELAVGSNCSGAGCGCADRWDCPM